jgi:hypothetical protein
LGGLPRLFCMTDFSGAFIFCLTDTLNQAG